MSAAAAKPHVERTRQGPVAILRLCNPPLNPLTAGMRQELLDVCHELAADTSVRAVVVTAAGRRAFSVGSDIKTFPQSAEEGRRLSESEHAAYAALEQLPQPVFAALRGHTLGGGLELALAADFRVADASACLGFPEVKIGVFASGGGTQRLAPLVGLGRAKELLYFGETISSADAQAIGLVNRVVPDGTSEEAALAWAAQLAGLPRRAVRATKRAVDVGVRAGRGAGHTAEVDEIAELYVSPDAREGARAFAEKRPARFTHA
ncbi:enoyl-CoA hydratase/isomerase family protein [Nonomuraea insulae]|uniref:Enoyl-CoA hydratase/isomerase family protein n=1 Tax=Nonomuraea insulae TaxID=1616787 RepID=A0ABW1D8D1_9ACTN